MNCPTQIEHLEENHTNIGQSHKETVISDYRNEIHEIH